MDVEQFVLASLPEAPCRVLEVGCGSGKLALGMAGAEYSVVAIDPRAPDGEMFRRVSLEQFSDAEVFDAVVASRSLHHLPDLDEALDKIVALLKPGGVVVIDEHAWERLDEATGRWFLQHVDHAEHGVPRSLPELLDWWRSAHSGLHGYAEMRADLDRRFSERSFAWVPYLYREFGGEVEPAEEQRLIDEGSIRATGFRYVGSRS